MPKPNASFLTTSITVACPDRSSITVGETLDRRLIQVSITQPSDRVGEMRLATIALNAAQFDALCSTKFELDVDKEEPQQ